MNEQYLMVRITKDAHRKLKELAEANKRSMGNQAEWIIEMAYKSFRVVSVDELPHPTDAEPVPVVNVVPND